MAIDDNASYELTGAQVKDLANKIKAKAADNIFVGATSAAPGSKGLVPQPQAGDDTKFLSGDGTWKTVSGGGGSSAKRIMILDGSGHGDYGIVAPYPVPIAGSSNADLAFVDLDTNTPLNIGGLASVLLSNQDVVFVYDDSQSYAPGTEGNFAKVTSARVTVSSDFDPSNPDPYDVQFMFIRADASTEYGEYTCTIERQAYGFKTMIYEGNDFVLVGEVSPSGNTIEMPNMVNDSNQTWAQATTTVSPNVLFMGLGSGSFDYLINYTPQMIYALNSGHKVALKAVINASDNAPVAVLSEVVLDSYSVVLSQGSWSDIRSVEDIIQGVMMGAMQLVMTGTRVVNGGTSAGLVRMTISNGTVQMGQ